MTLSHRLIQQHICVVFFSLACWIGIAHSATVTYSYDSWSRLTGAAYDNGAAMHYGYDDLGNRVSLVAAAPTVAVYEDAEDGTVAGWDVYDADPAGASIANVYDSDRDSNVIEVLGTGTANGYRLRTGDLSYWNDTKFKVMQWSMKYAESFTVYIAAQTKDGFRYIYYTPGTGDKLGDGTYIHHGLGAGTVDGSWHTFVRDLDRDLKEAQPDNELQAVLGFLIRGSGRVDEIQTRKTIPADQDSDGDGLSDADEIATYGTSPYAADSDNDGIEDQAELTYWGGNWNADLDNDGRINLLDPDSDNDLVGDGIETAQGFDPADATSVPVTIVYEDAEDGLTTGWDIYDNDPVGATIANVYDNDQNSKVIEFAGTGTSNGYRLRSLDGSYWNDAAFKVIQWSQKYDEQFTVYIAAQTKDGFRYIYYTPAATSNLGTGTYVHHGLGGAAMDGTWHTFVRDLAYDLKEAQPDNELQAVLGFLIRGSGRVDAIQTRKAIPAAQDSDNDGVSDVDEIGTYGTHPYTADSDNDGIEDQEELTYWGGNWNADPDNDTLVNLIDPDSDNDSFRDGIETAQGFDPADATSVPAAILYENGEDGTVSGWDIYDADPTGATITNVYDSERGSNIIELTGAATSNGYRLRNSDSSYWNDTMFRTIGWSQKYAEWFTVYIAAQTRDGFRYIYYDPSTTNTLGTGTYIHHGLGASSRDGSWHTFTRNLEADLKEAQPENELEAVLGFLIRGSGRVDDIETRK